MPDLLFISPVSPNANGTGRHKRAYQWVKYLLQEYQVHLLIFESNLKAIPITSDLPIASLRVLMVKNSRRYGWDFLKGFFGYLLSHWRQRDIITEKLATLTMPDKTRLAELYHGAKFDKALCFRMYLTKFAFFIDSQADISRWELDMDDLESDTLCKIAALYLRNLEFSRAWRNGIQALTFFFEEKRIPQLFQSIYVCSQEDRDKLSRRLKTTTISVFPNRLPRLATKSPEIKPANVLYRVLFVGALGYYPNKDAVRWFAKHVLPKLRKHSELWEFVVVGYGAPAKLIAWLTRRKGVTYLGAIADLNQIYDRIGQIVVPLRAGGGTKLKVIEGMLHERAVIASGEAVYGMALSPGKHYLQADTAAQFYQQCLKLVEEPRLYQMLVKHARDYANQKYTY